MIAALYVQTGGVYFGLPDVDPWDEARDARKYAGPHPVVAHPPCARWSRLAGFTEFRFGLKRGDDGGCFAAALAAVRGWGGVLEHPEWSRAFGAHGLPRPIADGWQRTLCGGWVCSVEQGNYGHVVSKPTWLYAYGVDDLPQLNWAKGSKAGAGAWLGQRTGGAAGQRFQRRNTDVAQNKSLRSRTPIPFRNLLLAIARSAA